MPTRSVTNEDPLAVALTLTAAEPHWLALLDAGAPVRPMHVFRALEESDMVGLRAMSVRAPAAVVAARTPDGLNALHVAVLDDVLSAVELLAPLADGALVNAAIAAPPPGSPPAALLPPLEACGDARDWSRGRSALPERFASASAFIWAVILGRSRLLPALLSAGADARVVLQEPRTPLLAIAPVRTLRALTGAVPPGSPLLLRAASTSSSGGGDWCTPLHVATAHLQARRVRALLRCDARAARAAPAALRGATPLHWLGAGVRCGAECGRDASVPHPGARWAAAAAIVAALLAAGAEVEAPDADGRTPLDRACARFDVASAAALRAHVSAAPAAAACAVIAGACGARRPAVSVELDVVTNVFKICNAAALQQRMPTLPRCAACRTRVAPVGEAAVDGGGARPPGADAAAVNAFVMGAPMIPLPTCVVGALLEAAAGETQ